ncbi:glycosyltransferase family 4 protein [bacterium]|nr:glycosyltransferase family 4 protein [bacterium]
MSDRPLNVLLVCRSFPAHRAGGMEWHAQDVLEGLIAAGHTVHILTTNLPDRAALKPLRTNGVLETVGGSGGGAYSKRFLLTLARRARQIAERESIDIIHAQGFAGVPLVFRARKMPPIVTTIHGTHWSETPLDRRVRHMRSPVERMRDIWRFKHRFALWPLWWRFLRKRPNLIVDSDFTARELRREVWQLNPAVVPLGMNLGRLRPRRTRLVFDPEKRFLVPDSGQEHPMLLFAISRLEEIKGLDVPLKALGRLGNKTGWHFAIGGDGPDRARLETIAARLGLQDRVTFLGRVPDADLADWLAAADLFLNPDRGQPAFGLTVAEALAAGTPVLASRVGAHPEVLRRGDGILAPPGNPAAWRRALEHLLARLPENERRRSARRERARERFHRDLMIRRLVGVYRDVLAG